MSKNLIKNFLLIFLAFFFCIVKTNSAHAYLGLAPLIPIIGQGILYLVIFIIFGLGLILYPLKIFYKKLKDKKKIKSKKNVNKDEV